MPNPNTLSVETWTVKTINLSEGGAEVRVAPDKYGAGGLTTNVPLALGRSLEIGQQVRVTAELIPAPPSSI